MNAHDLDVAIGETQNEIHFATALADDIQETAGNLRCDDERARARLVAMAAAIARFLADAGARLETIEMAVRHAGAPALSPDRADGGG